METQVPVIDGLEILADNFENTKRKTVLIKVRQAYSIFKDMIHFYGCEQLILLINQHGIKSIEALSDQLSARYKREEWLNIGGQLMTVSTLSSLKDKVKKGRIKIQKSV